MTTVMRYDPFREAISLRNAVDQLFEQSFVRPNWFGGTSNSGSLVAPMDVYETEQGYQVRLLLPGVNPQDIELTTQQNTMTIKGKVHPFLKEGQKVNWLLQEIGTGSFERSVTFPKLIDADKIETSYEHGLLTISVPVHETSRPKRISILNASNKQPERLTVEAGAR